jgi:tripartite-type tricarboxylate transporter receptor subunit TctC
LADGWRQQALIDNRAGAGTVVGTEIVAKAAPDGYTLLERAVAHAINPALFRKLPKNTSRSTAGVSAHTPAEHVVACVACTWYTIGLPN